MEELIGRAWGNGLKNNTSLVHLDLSNNQMSEVTCRIIGKKLKKNHTLFGIHMAGNACYVDSLGFYLFPEDLPAKEAPLQL